jgi:Formate dehydrogenase N, transmembrane
MGFGLVASLFHYFTVGPNEVPEEAEDEALAHEHQQSGNWQPVKTARPGGGAS